jgi:hypothetical protein
VTAPRRDCDEAEVRRLVEMQAIVDYLTDPGPLFIRSGFEKTTRTTKRDLEQRIERIATELDAQGKRQAKIAQGLVLLLRRELP